MVTKGKNVSQDFYQLSVFIRLIVIFYSRFHRDFQPQISGTKNYVKPLIIKD
jgi:hypothetical protein